MWKKSYKKFNNYQMTECPVLYSFRRCPYAIAARIVLYSSEIKVELREVCLRNKPVALTNASPKGTVPTLVLPDSTVLAESLDIMHWALTTSSVVSSWRRSSCLSDQRLTVDRDELISLTAAYKYPERPRESRHVVPSRTLDELLTHFDSHLSNFNFLVDNHAHLADAVLFPFIRQIERVDKAAFRQMGHQNLFRWYDCLDKFYNMDHVMARHPFWQQGDAKTFFYK